MRIRAYVLVCVALPWIAPAAEAADGSFYVTAKLGRASVDREFETGPLDTVETDDDGWSAGVGYSFSRHLALQAEYLDFGAATQTRLCGPLESLCLSAAPLRTETTALSMNVVGRVPLGSRASAFGKAGLARLDTQATSLDTVESKADHLKGHFGAGLSLAVWRQLSVLAEYETTGAEVSSLSVGASFEF